MWAWSEDLMKAQYTSPLGDDNFSLLYVLIILRQYGDDVDILSLRGVMKFTKGAQVLANATNTVLPCVSPNQQLLVLAE